MRRRYQMIAVRVVLMLTVVMCMTVVESIPGYAEQVERTRTVRVSAGINSALYLDEEGNPQGYCAGFLKQLAWQNNWELEYVEGSWSESVQNLYDGKIDLLLPAQMTEERKDTMGFSAYIGGYQPIGLYARSDSEIYYDDYEAIDQKRIAVSLGTSNETELDKYAAEHNISYIPVECNTTEDKIKALNNGEVDLIAFSTFNSVPDGKVVAVLDYLPFYYCTNINDTAFLTELNIGMRNVMSCCPDMMASMYASAIESSNLISYTKEEMNAVRNIKKLVCGMYKDSLPLAGEGENKEAVGIYVDLVKEIEEVSGIPIEIRLVDRSENIYDYMAEGNLDFVVSTKSLAKAATDTSGILASDSIMEYSTVIVTKSDYSIGQKPNPVFALTSARAYWESYIKENYADSKIIYYDNTKECMLAVQNGEADVTLINSWEYNYQSKNSRFDNLIEWESMRMQSELIVGTTTQLDSVVLSVIDKSINRITEDRKNDIVLSNVNMKYTSYDAGDRFYKFKSFLTIAMLILIVFLMIFAVFIFMKRKNERNLKEKNRELEAANKAKTDFLSRMSHELRTPINAINGYAEVLEDNIQESDCNRKEELLKSVVTTKRATKYLLAIISDILDIQNIENGKIQLVKEEINATEYMKNVVDMISKEAEEKNITFTYERLTHFSEAYLLDGVRFQQILLNILHNAIKFTPKGGIVKLSAGVVDQDDRLAKVEFIVSDTGIGMSEEFVKNKLFEKFAQENTDITSPYEGCGTGLAICKQLIELMGGEIHCVSEQGRGTTFTITISIEHIKKRRRKDRDISRIAYDLSGICVLLCEDNPMNQDMEKMVLEKMKCQVDIADDGVIGLEKFAQSELEHYSIVLMDIRMPNMNGLETTRKIRALDRRDAKTVPILAVSANAYEEDVEMSIQAGMNEHLAKPVSAQILYKKIREYCVKG